jgi:class 3 adenylate cyclase
MKWFESLVAYLFPTILIEPEDWRQQWEINQRDSFVSIVRIIFPFASVGYLLHYFLFDKPMGLEPLDHWFRFRTITAAILMLCFVFYLSPLSNGRFYKVPAILMCAALCISQAFVAQWYGLEAWVFCFLFVLASVLIIRTTALYSLAFTLVVIAIQAPILMSANVALSNIVSGAIVTTMITVAIRSTYLAEVRHFLLNQEHNDNQSRINELNIEFSNRIASFIPRVIADRLNAFVNRDRMSVLEASVEALRARKCDIACLFSDIRGYTQGSKRLDSFVNESVLPEVKLCADAVENRSGIPRKVGDLLFAYFDSSSIHLNLLRAVISGVEIARVNEAMNETANEMRIKRYILISCGDAIVGNFGGLDSSVEITALGSPVNYLSRLDDLTKNPKVAELLCPGDLIVCERSVSLLRELGISLCFTPIDLSKLGVEVRDFPETRLIYTLKPSDAHYYALLEPYQSIRDPDDVEWARESRGERFEVRPRFQTNS